jgi:hypothetical protein
MTEPTPGDRLLLTFGDLAVPVAVIDTRRAFGRTDALVTPVGGAGEAWVQSARLTSAQPS